jgi:hypothetical protein
MSNATIGIFELKSSQVLIPAWSIHVRIPENNIQGSNTYCNFRRITETSRASRKYNYLHIEDAAAMELGFVARRQSRGDSTATMHRAGHRCVARLHAVTKNRCPSSERSHSIEMREQDDGRRNVVPL